MSLDKAIEHGKEKRKPYRRSKRFDRSCRNHGGCGYCLNNRMASTKRQLEKANYSDEEKTMSLSNRHLINIIEGYAKRDQALPAHVWASALEAGLDPQGIYDNYGITTTGYQIKTEGEN